MASKVSIKFLRKNIYKPNLVISAQNTKNITNKNKQRK